MEKLLTMSDVRRLAGWKAGHIVDPSRGVRRKLQMLENERGIEVLIKIGRYYYTTLTKLKNLLPEIFESSEEKDRELYALKCENIKLRRQLKQLSVRLNTQKTQ